jgi:hypothetical protein
VDWILVGLVFGVKKQDSPLADNQVVHVKQLAEFSQFLLAGKILLCHQFVLGGLLGLFVGSEWILLNGLCLVVSFANN